MGESGSSYRCGYSNISAMSCRTSMGISGLLGGRLVSDLDNAASVALGFGFVVVFAFALGVAFFSAGFAVVFFVVFAMIVSP
jgi:hypothetical protein